ncbi:MAG: hypothetical protein DSY42_05890 [Aquifex sp.]|nr:MAG: hypothetical protein DSY42_05890 [Aquifex sp.]
MDEFLLRKTIEHLETSQNALSEFNFRDFASRFYYAYINLLALLGIKKGGHWHKKESYEFPSDSNFEKVWEELNVWRLLADYEVRKVQEQVGRRKKFFSEVENEFKEFLRVELINFLEDELKIYLLKSDLSEPVKYLILKKLEVVIQWLKIATL